MEHYTRAGVAQYVIVDDVSRGRRERRLRLLDYRLEGDAYRLHPPDAAGRVPLAIANLWLGIERDHVVCYDEQGVPFGDYATVVRRAAQEAERAQRETERAQREAERAQQEAAAREAEARANGIDDCHLGGWGGKRGASGSREFQRGSRSVGGGDSHHLGGWGGKRGASGSREFQRGSGSVGGGDSHHLGGWGGKRGASGSREFQRGSGSVGGGDSGCRHELSGGSPPRRPARCPEP